MKSLLMKNKVLIAGLLSAVLLAISEVVKGNDASIKMLVFSGFIAAASFLARNLRGQAASIAGLVGNAVAAYVAQQANGHVEWSQIISQTLLTLIAIWVGPAKSLGYEKSDTIMEAKKEGEVIQPTNIVPNPTDKP